MLIVLDNVLSEEDMVKMHVFFADNPNNRNMQWADGDIEAIKEAHSPLTQLVQVAGKYFDINDMCGIEFWSHYGTKPNWHKDRDEKLAATTGVDKYPLCSIVYYAHIENLIGGRFMTESEIIVPRNNRMLIFSPGILHTVEDYQGTRLSVSVNPWEQTPLEYV
jgi:hypothetical protein